MAQNPITKHKAAYEALHKAQEEAQARAIELEQARQAAVSFIAEKMADTAGIKTRAANKEQAHGPLMIGIEGSDDPIVELIKATESSYFQRLGVSKALPPLAIYHVNGWQGGPVECPKCGHVIEHEELPVPQGATGRGPNPNEPV